MQSSGHPDHQSLGAALLCRRSVTRLSNLPHPLRQRVGMLLDLSPGDERSVVVEIHFHAVARIIGHQLADHCEPVSPDLRVGV